MAKRGFIHVLIDSPTAAIAANWLSRRPTINPLALADDAYDVARQNAIAGLVKQLAKAGRSNRGSRYLAIDRFLAEWFVRLSTPQWPIWGVSWPRAVRVMRRRLVWTLGQRSRVGRPSLRSAHIMRRVDREHFIEDERHLRRLRRRHAAMVLGEHNTAAFDQWFAEVQRRGETILTTDLPFPETT